MTAKREPLPRWRYPSRNCLLGTEFPSGRPAFTPLPTVTNLLNANLCPVAIYHDLIHGVDNALIPQYGKEKQRRDLFHKFISRLKLSLKNRTFILSGYDIQSQLGMVQDLFLCFSHRQGFSTAEASDILKLYIEPWIRRKLRSGESLYKDYQVWLLWKILYSLKLEQLPPQWNSVDFQNFDLVVETPYNDFTIKPDNEGHVMDTHYAYAWINDISISESSGVFQEVFENAVCTPLTPHAECWHKFLNCFTRDYPYPQSRPEIKRTFKPWYRLLLWEKIWEGDLFQYQLLMLSREELIRQGLISEGQIVSFKDNKMELEVGEENIGSIRGHDRYTIIPYGTLFCGKRETATLVEAEKNHLTMELHGIEEIFFKDAILLPLPSDSPPPIMQEPPAYLKKQMQKALLRLQYSGVIKPEKSQEKSLVQLLEGVFGRQSIRRGSK